MKSIIKTIIILIFLSGIAGAVVVNIDGSALLEKTTYYANSIGFLNSSNINSTIDRNYVNMTNIPIDFPNSTVANNTVVWNSTYNSSYVPYQGATSNVNLSNYNINAGNISINGNYLNSKKVGTFSRDISTASGTQAVTGVGFKPSAIIFIVNVDGSNGLSLGWDDGTDRNGVLNGDSVIEDNWYNAVSNSLNAAIFIQTGSGNRYDGKINSFDSDGFTIGWEKTGTTTGTAIIMYLAFR